MYERRGGVILACWDSTRCLTDVLHIRTHMPLSEDMVGWWGDRSLQQSEKLHERGTACPMHPLKVSSIVPIR